MPVSDTEAVTLGEVNRTMLRLVDKVEVMSENMTGYPTWHDVNRMNDYAAERVSRQGDRIDALEGWNKWLVRAFGTAFIGAVITALLVFS